MKLGKKIRQKIRIFELLPSEYSDIRILKNDRILQTLAPVGVEFLSGQRQIIDCKTFFDMHRDVAVAKNDTTITEHRQNDGVVGPSHDARFYTPLFAR